MDWIDGGTRYGNALYVLYDNWEEVSQRSQLELLCGTDTNLDRIVHTRRMRGSFHKILAAREASLRYFGLDGVSTRWIFTLLGQSAYYQTGGHICTRDGCYSYWISDVWWYRVPESQASYYISDNWVFTPNGKPALYYGDRHG